jgi:hypothetical protein
LIESASNLRSPDKVEHKVKATARVNGGWNVSRSTRPPPSAALLDRYRCPVPFHAVRTRFLGDIASPVMSASPLDAVKALWGGELPEFDSLDAVNELLRILIMGL